MSTLSPRLRPVSGVTATARPVDVVVIAIRLDLRAVIFAQQMRARWEEARLRVPTDDVVFAAQVTALAADPQGDCVLGSFVFLKRIDESQQPPGIDC